MTKNFFDEQEEPLIPTPVDNPTVRRRIVSKNYTNRIKNNILIIAPVLLAVIIATYFFIKMIKSPKDYNQNLSASGNYENTRNQDIIDTNHYIDLDQIIVNLASSGSKQDYLKLILTLHFGSEAETKNAQLKLPMIIDSFQTFLRELRLSDLTGSGSIIRLKEELAKRINKIISPISVKNILIKEILVN